MSIGDTPYARARDGRIEMIGVTMRDKKALCARLYAKEITIQAVEALAATMQPCRYRQGWMYCVYRVIG
jgi:hypothetical protein